MGCHEQAPYAQRPKNAVRPEKRIVDSGGVRLVVRDSGGRRKPVVLVHGLGLARPLGAGWLPSLAPAGYGWLPTTSGATGRRAPRGSRQEGEDRAPSTVDGDPPWLPPALLPTIPGLLWFGTNEESVVEMMLDCLSPCASTREGIEEAAWEAYGKGRG